ncbi:MAG TPA: methyltransferase [Pseudonocardia sp.]|jgi:SAM-dependent methyltransferase|nr:methyltransferase [Pseudonocardia sp.]
MAATPRVPPARIAQAGMAARDQVQRLHRRMAPAPVTLLEMIWGSMITQALYVAAKFGIADLLAAGPMTPEEIARRVDASPEGVFRLLRALASRGVFAVRPDGRFELTPLAEPLRSDAPVSMRSVALLWGSPEAWEHWSHLLDSVRTGEPTIPVVRGMDFWEFLASKPDFAAEFNSAMTTFSDLVKAPVLAAYDFSPFATIVDVAGGHGAMLAAILQRTPAAHGVLFDQPSVTAGAGDLLRAHGVESRCAVESGSFFDGVPAGGDAYIMKNIIHDWSDTDALAILRNIRKVIRPGGRLVLIEMVLPEGNSGHLGSVFDLEMLLDLGSRERTERDFRQLLATAGFELARVVPTASIACVVESKPI